MLRYSVPPGYQRQQPVKRPKLGPWVGVIDAILEEDKTQPVKQRHTAKRIFDRLGEEYGFSGGYTIVKDYVRMAALHGQEMFVPLTHPAGDDTLSKPLIQTSFAACFKAYLRPNHPAGHKRSQEGVTLAWAFQHANDGNLHARRFERKARSAGICDCSKAANRPLQGNGQAD
jgi:hypothetical protein